MKGAAAASLVGLLAGLALGWQLWRPRPVVETPAPEERQPDGSLVLGRAPDPGARPAHVIPRGAAVERVATVTVQPDPVVKHPEPMPGSRDIPTTSPPAFPDSAPRNEDSCSCAPVHVDLSLVRLEDGTRRVIASARGGTVLGGVDVPVESAAPARVLRWSAGAVHLPAEGAWGGYLTRDLDRVAILPLPARVGGFATTGPEGWRAGVMIGLRW